MEPNIARNRWITIFLVISLISVFWLFQKFLYPILISMLIVLMCSSSSKKLEDTLARLSWLKNSATIISAGLITLSMIVLMVIPLITLISYIINKINYLEIFNLKNQIITWFAHVSWINSSLKQTIIYQMQTLISDSSTQENYKKSAVILLSSMKKLSGSTLELTMILAFFFLILWKRYQIETFLVTLNPLPVKITRKVANEVASTLKLVFVTLLVLAIVQGFAFAGLMMFYQYNAPVLGFAAGICSMIPVFGAALVWVPIAISEFIAGNILGAIIIVLFGWLVMAVIIDNFLRIFILRKIAISLKQEKPVNEFLLFFSIAGGLSVAGFWGIILGPALLALFLALTQIYSTSKNIDQI